MVKRKESTFNNINISLKTLTTDLTDISSQLDDVVNKYPFGVKILKAQEEERQRLSKDILLGPVVSMKQAVEVSKICEDKIDIDTNQVIKEMQNLKINVRESLKSIRKIIYNLRPMSLDDLGLTSTLQRFISNFQEETSIDVLFKASHSNVKISSVISLTVFRVVQECLNNVKKHSKAKNAKVLLEFLVDKLNLVISDDGIGFKTDGIGDPNYDIGQNLGLFSIKQRVELLKGKFQMEGIPNQGTRIFVSLPLINNQICL
jgi:two-component system sensor histidine kinase DegS